MIKKTIDLHVDAIVQVNGCVLTKKGLERTDIRGRVSAKQGAVQGNEWMMVLERGGYQVRFLEDRPEEFDLEVSYEVYQNDLFLGSMVLTLNSTPFTGYLRVDAASQIEVGAKLATLVFKFPNKVAKSAISRKIEEKAQAAKEIEENV